MDLERPSPLSGLRALVVEDHPINQRILALALARFGCRPTIAAHGQEALDAFARETFDIILMDVMMPVMDGHEATRRLRAAGCRLPILVVSANAFPSDREAALAAGASGFLAKPVAIDALRTHMEALMGPARATAAPATG